MKELRKVLMFSVALLLSAIVAVLTSNDAKAATNIAGGIAGLT